jgi:integrase
MSQARHKTRHPGIYQRHRGPCTPDPKNCKVAPESWQASWVDSDGRRQWAKAATEKDARRLQREGANRAAGQEPEVKRQAMTLRQFVTGPWDAHLAEQVELRLRHPEGNPLPGMKPNTAAFYRDGGRRLCEVIGESKLQGITGQLLTSALAKLSANGLSGATVHCSHVAARRLFADAKRWGHVARNPALDIESREVAHPDDPHAEPWDEPDRSRFFASLDGDPLATCWRFLAATGLRRSELCALRWSDIHLDARDERGRPTPHVDVNRARVMVRGRVTEGTPKTKQSRRRVSLDQETARMMRAHKDEQKVQPLDRFVFTTPRGEPLSPTKVSAAFRAAVERIGQDRTAHALRHLHAQILLEQGTALEIVSRRLGHSDISITHRTYQRWAKNRDVEAAQAFGAAGLWVGNRS